jgi:hypothetical protein
MLSSQSLKLVPLFRTAQAITRKRTRFPCIQLSVRREKSSDSLTEARNVKWLETINATGSMESWRLYRYFGLENFTRSEFQEVFQTIRNSLDDTTKDQAAVEAITPAHLQSFLEQRIQELEDENDHINMDDDETTVSLRRQFAEAEAKRCWNFFEEKGPKNGELTQEDLAAILKKTASSIDTKRVWPITLSMLLVGSSVGVVTPAMPFVVQNLGLTAGEYGLVVSAFALAKMTGNIPSAVLVERHGRKVRVDGLSRIFVII